MSSNIIGPLPNKSVAPSEKVEKASGNLIDMEEPVVTIRINDLYNRKEKDNTKKYRFQGKSESSKRWFNLDNEWLEEKFSPMNWISIKTL